MNSAFFMFICEGIQLQIYLQMISLHPNYTI